MRTMPLLPKRAKEQLIASLRWSEKYAKTDMVYLTGGGFWLALGYIIQVASGLIVTIAFANLLPKESYGTYQFILSMAGALGAFTLSGMGVAITRAVAQGNDGILPVGFRIKLLWSTGITLASVAVSSYYFLNGNNDLGIAFLIVGAFSPFIEGFSLYQPFLFGKEHFKQSVLLGAWRKPLPVVALLSALYFTSNPIVLIFIYFIANTASLAALYAITIKKYALTKKYDPGTIRYSKHLSVMNLLSRVAEHTDKIMIFFFIGAPAVAAFTVAQLPVQYTKNALNTMRSLIMPKLSKRDFPTLQKTLPRKVMLFSAVAGAATIAYVLISPIVFPLLFPDYTESILITQVLALLILFLPRSAYLHALTAHQKIKTLYIIRLSVPALKIVATVILVPLYGLWGAVIALLVAELVAALLSWILFKNERTD